MSTPRRLLPATISLLVLLSACATTPSRAADDPVAATPSGADLAADRVIRIEVKHDRADGGIATIYIQPVAGVRVSLGTIGAGESKVFSYEAETRTITLIAIDASGQALMSRQTTVPRGAGLVWNLQVNSVRIRSGDG